MNHAAHYVLLLAWNSIVATLNSRISTHPRLSLSPVSPFWFYFLDEMLEKGALDDGRIVGGIGKIQNLSSSVGFITRTLEGRVDFKDNIYFRKETIEDNISSGIIDLRHYVGP